MYVLKDILWVREWREKSAEENLAKVRAKLREAIRVMEEKEKELKEHREFMKKEEERLFKQIINKKVKREDVMELKDDLNKLRDKEVEKEKELEKAKEDVEKAKEEEEGARQHYIRMMVSRQKIQEHKNTWVEEYTYEQEMGMDKELEEFQRRASRN